MPKESSTQRLDWNAELIGKFWDYTSARTDLSNEYFTNVMGSAVARFLNHARPLKGLQVLDYGCGPGFLEPHLFARGASVAALDFSEASVAEANRKFHGLAAWHGAKQGKGSDLPWANNTFDVVVCLETIEHALPEHLDTLFSELHRVLKVGGTAVFSTPNDEVLYRNFVYCPNCDLEFHRWQHLRSFSAQSLSEKLMEHSFSVVYSRGINLATFNRNWTPHWKDLSLRTGFNYLRYWTLQAADKISPRPFPEGREFKLLARYAAELAPNLFAVAIKT